MIVVVVNIADKKKSRESESQQHEFFMNCNTPQTNCSETTQNTKRAGAI